MKFRNIFIIIGLIILLLIIGEIFVKQNKIYSTTCGQYAEKEIIINNKKIDVLISDDNCKMVLGLSGKENLKGNLGMLFVFDTAGNYGFWMKDMKFPLDILWISDDLHIVGIEKNLATSTYPQIFGRNYFAKYVLELPAGYLDTNSIKVGNKIFISEKTL